MAITIDGGTFLVGNSFVTMVEADSFHMSRQNTAWDEADAEFKEAALIRAFDYLSVQNWATNAFLTGVPIKVKNAQCVAALKELTNNGAMLPDITPGVKRESIDGAISTEYFSGSGSGTIHTAVENMIRPYLKTFGMRMRLVRGGG